MNNATTPGIQNLMRIETLIAQDLSDILSKENDNTNNINLYNNGEYWVAFEKSAYQLEQISDNVNSTVVIRLKDRPFPLIFNTISNNDAKMFSKQTKQHHFLQLPTKSLNSQSFNAWYRELTEQ